MAPFLVIARDPPLDSFLSLSLNPGKLGAEKYPINRLIMQIFWHGNTCVRIEAEHGDQKATLVTDPYGSETGLRFPRTLAPDVVALSHEDLKRFPDDAFTNTPFLIHHPGEYEANGLFVFGISLATPEAPSPTNLIYRFEIEGMNIGFLGGLHRVLTESEIEKLGTIDILLLPVGGGELLDSKRAVEVMNAIEPRLVIPLAHQVEGLKQELGTADSFCKQVGVCTRTDGNKLKISRKDLPSDTLTVAVLERA